MTMTVIPEELQTRLDPVVVDDEVAKAKGKLLSDIKRSVYVYRVDCGGCNACEIEIFSSITPVFDVERFGIKVVPTPRHADILVYTGAVTRSMRMPALRAYEAAPDPKIIVSYGACGCTGGIFHDNYCVWGGTDKICQWTSTFLAALRRQARRCTVSRWHSASWPRSSTRPTISRARERLPPSLSPIFPTSFAWNLNERLAGCRVTDTAEILSMSSWEPSRTAGMSSWASTTSSPRKAIRVVPRSTRSSRVSCWQGR